MQKQILFVVLACSSLLYAADPKKDCQKLTETKKGYTPSPIHKHMRTIEGDLLTHQEYRNITAKALNEQLNDDHRFDMLLYLRSNKKGRNAFFNFSSYDMNHWKAKATQTVYYTACRAIEHLSLGSRPQGQNLLTAISPHLNNLKQVSYEQYLKQREGKAIAPGDYESDLYVGKELICFLLTTLTNVNSTKRIQWYEKTLVKAVKEIEALEKKADQQLEQLITEPIGQNGNQETTPDKDIIPAVS